MKLKKKKFNPKGLTLIELLVVLAIGALIMAALLGLYVTGQRYFMTQGVRSNILRDGRYVLTWISRDIREAVQVLESWDVYTTSTSLLVLQVPSVDADRLIIDIENDFDYIIYRLNTEYPTKLERIIDANDGVSSRVDSSRVLANRVNSFGLSSEGVELSSVSDFSQVSSIDIALTTREIRFDRTYQETLYTGVRLRNKQIEGS